MKHDFRAGDVAGRIDAADHIERRGRVTGRGDDIERRKDVGDDLVALVDRNGGRGAFFVAEPLRAVGVDDGHDLGRKAFLELALFGHRRRGKDECEQSDEEPARP